MQNLFKVQVLFICLLFYIIFISNSEENHKYQSSNLRLSLISSNITSETLNNEDQNIQLLNTTSYKTIEDIQAPSSNVTTNNTNDYKEIDSTNTFQPLNYSNQRISQGNESKDNYEEDEGKNLKEGHKSNQTETTENSTKCPERDNRYNLLCKLTINKFCKSHYLSEQLSTFWIICPIYSANHFKTSVLYYLHKNFRSYIQSYGINLQTVEVIFPGQEFQLTKPNNEPYDLQYTDKWIFAMRENLVNVGIKHLPNDWEYVAWIDQHIFWMDPYWFEKSIWLMSHYNIVHLLNGSDFWNLQNTTDYSLKGAIKHYYEVGQDYWRHAPQQWGLAWATNKDTFSKLGGLLDICIGTYCDFFQAVAYTGVKYITLTGNKEVQDMVESWQDHAIKVYERKVGFLDSKVVHFMHCLGCQTSNYGYHTYFLTEHDYTPSRDLVRDEEGRLSLINEMLGRDLWKEVYGGDFKKRD